MEDITDAGYVHTEKVSKDFEIKILGEHHGLYVQSDTLLLADVFQNCKNAWSCSFSYCTRFSMAGSFKNYQSKIRSFN